MNNHRQTLVTISKLCNDVDRLIIKKVMSGHIKSTSVKRIANHRYKAMTLREPFRSHALDIINLSGEFAEVLNKEGAVKARPVADKLDAAMAALASAVDQIGL